MTTLRRLTRALRNGWRNLTTPVADTYPNGCRRCYDLHCQAVDADTPPFANHARADAIRQTMYEHLLEQHPTLYDPLGELTHRMMRGPAMRE